MRDPGDRNKSYIPLALLLMNSTGLVLCRYSQGSRWCKFRFFEAHHIRGEVWDSPHKPNDDLQETLSFDFAFSRYMHDWFSCGNFSFSYMKNTISSLELKFLKTLQSSLFFRLPLLPRLGKWNFQWLLCAIDIFKISILLLTIPFLWNWDLYQLDFL